MTTTFIPTPNADGLVKLSGTISNLTVKRGYASFALTESDRNQMGLIAIAAAVVGAGGPAMSTAANASNMEEPADYVEFELNGEHVKGWVWRNPFKEGDSVTIAAEKRDDHLFSFGIARPSDQIIGLYPHCSRTESTHVPYVIRSWLLWGGGGLLAIMIPASWNAGGVDAIYSTVSIITFIILMTFFAFIAYMTNRKLMPFVRLAEKVFHTLELPNAEHIDLKKSSKLKRTEQDKQDVEYGIFYYKY